MGRVKDNREQGPSLPVPSQNGLSLQLGLFWEAGFPPCVPGVVRVAGASPRPEAKPVLPLEEAGEGLGTKVSRAGSHRGRSWGPLSLGLGQVSQEHWQPQAIQRQHLGPQLSLVPASQGSRGKLELNLGALRPASAAQKPQGAHRWVLTVQDL